MSAVALLLGLLVIAYVGSHLMGGRSGSFRLASGAEYLVLGVALGPYALGVAERSTLQAFQPLAMIGTAWLTLVIGVDFGVQHHRRITLRGLVLGVVLALVSAAATFGATRLVASRFTSFSPDEIRTLSVGVAIVGCETTRHATRWVVGRHLAEGVLSRIVSDVAEADDLVPLLGIAVLFPALAPMPLHASISWMLSAAATPVLGAVLGGTAAALLRGEPRASDGWGVILGAVLLATGIASRLGLSPQAATFALGLALAATSRHRAELRGMLARSEQGVLLPILVIAGGLVKVHEPVALGLVVAAAFVSRWAVRLLVSPALIALAGAPSRSTFPLSLGLLPSGALSIALGIACSNRFPGPVGDSVLAVAVALSVLGELVGPSGLKRALAHAGEIPEPAPPAPDEPAAKVPELEATP